MSIINHLSVFLFLFYFLASYMCNFIPLQEKPQELLAGWTLYCDNNLCVFERHECHYVAVLRTRPRGPPSDKYK